MRSSVDYTAGTRTSGSGSSSSSTASRIRDVARLPMRRPRALSTKESKSAALPYLHAAAPEASHCGPSIGHAILLVSRQDFLHPNFSTRSGKRCCSQSGEYVRGTSYARGGAAEERNKVEVGCDPFRSQDMTTVERTETTVSHSRQLG